MAVNLTNRIKPLSGGFPLISALIPDEEDLKPYGLVKVAVNYLRLPSGNWLTVSTRCGARSER